MIDTLTDSLPVADVLGDTLLVAQEDAVCVTDDEPVDETEAVPDTEALPEELPVTDVEGVAVPHADGEDDVEAQEVGETETEPEGEPL